MIHAQTGKVQTKIALAAMSTSDQKILDQNDPNPDAHYLFSDAAADCKVPRLWAGHESLDNPSEGGESLLLKGVMIKKIKLQIRI